MMRGTEKATKVLSKGLTDNNNAYGTFSIFT